MNEELKVGDMVKFADSDALWEIKSCASDGWVRAYELLGDGLNLRYVRKDGTMYGVKVCEKVQPEPDYASWKPGMPVKVRGEIHEQPKEAIFLGYSKGTFCPFICAHKTVGLWEIRSFSHAELIQPEGQNNSGEPDYSQWVGKRVFVRDRNDAKWEGPFDLDAYAPNDEYRFYAGCAEWAIAKLA